MNPWRTATITSTNSCVSKSTTSTLHGDTTLFVMGFDEYATSVFRSFIVAEWCIYAPVNQLVIVSYKTTLADASKFKHPCARCYIWKCLFRSRCVHCRHLALCYSLHLNNKWIQSPGPSLVWIVYEGNAHVMVSPGTIRFSYCISLKPLSFETRCQYFKLFMIGHMLHLLLAYLYRLSSLSMDIIHLRMRVVYLVASTRRCVLCHHP